MSKFWSDVVQQLTPYVPGEQPKLSNLVKLNTNENPYPPSPRAQEAIRREAGADLRLYQDPNADSLRQAIADYHAVEPNNVFVGNGSDEVLAHAFLALLKHAQPVLFPDISYSFYPVYCGLYGIDYVTVPLAADFSIDIRAYRRPNGGIIFPNPNAPTGCLLPLDRIEELLAANPDSAVVVDEAYIDFGGETAIPLISRFPNLLVVQTLSKSRSLAMAGAIASFEDRAYFESMRAAVIATRVSLVEKVKALGFEVLPSAANFIFMRHPKHDAAELSAWLRSRHIIVRHFKSPRIEQFLRLTIGTDEQCALLVSALEQYIAGEK